MVKFIKVNTKKVKSTVEAPLYSITKNSSISTKKPNIIRFLISSKETFSMIISMDMGSTYGMITELTMASGHLEKCTEKGNFVGQMGLFTRENTKMT
jgi:hypothetical protein